MKTKTLTHHHKQAKSAEPLVSKEELIHLIATQAGLPLDETRRCLDAFTKVVVEQVGHGTSVRLIGFGSWHRQMVAEHSFLPIRSSERTTLASHYKVRFHAGADLVRAVREEDVPSES